MWTLIIRNISFLFTSLIILMGMLVLAGWYWEADILKRPIPGLVAMNPLTALSFILSGLSFFVLYAELGTTARKRLGRTLAGATIAISMSHLCNVVFDTTWHIDHLVFAGQLDADKTRGYTSDMAISTALGFILSSLSMLLLHYNPAKRWMPAHAMAIATFALGFFSLLGYLYDVPEFYSLLKRMPMAVHTAICFILISLSLLLVHRNMGITKEFTQPLAGAYIGRTLLLAVFTVPVILGALRIYFLRDTNVSAELGTTFLTISLIIFFSALLLYGVILLNRKDLQQKKAEDALRISQELYSTLVMSIKDYAIIKLDTAGNIQTWNEGAERIKGYKASEIIGKNISVCYTEEDLALKVPARIMATAIKNGRHEEEGWRVRKDNSLFWADVVLTPLYDKRGNLNGFAKVTRDFTEYRKAQDVLTSFNEELARMIQEKTSMLEDTTNQLRQLSSHLQTAREEERKYIAREIHDELGQMLTGLRMDVVWLRKRMEHTSPAIQERFEQTMELLNDTRKTIHRISTDLHPAMLYDLGLKTAMASLVRDFEKRSGIAVTFSASTEPLDDMLLAQELSIGIYRIFQESLTNIARHAEATEAVACLSVERDYIRMEIQDNGKGFDVDEITGSTKTLGLISIRERALMLEGRLKIKTKPGEGTKILLTIPLKTK